MFQPNTAFHNDNQPFSFTFTISDSPETNAKNLKALLLKLSRAEQNEKFKTTLRNAADQVRVIAFGYNRQTTKTGIIRLLQEFEQCEIIDFVDELKIEKNEIKAALDELISENKISTLQRRRWQEPGKHYNDIYILR